MSKIVFQRTCQFLRFFIGAAERKITLPVSYPDLAVLLEPVVLLRREKRFGLFIVYALFGQLLVEIRVFVLYLSHSRIQFLDKIGSFLVDSIEIVRAAYSADRKDFLGKIKGVHSCKTVDLAFYDHFHRFVLAACQRNDLRRDFVLFSPLFQKGFLDTILVHADLLAVER